jgi:N-sulfoglucosamine sulfohydrolase
MRRREFLFSASFAAPFKRPNIVIFLADDLGWRDIEPYGTRQVRTPVLAALAKEGMCLDAMFTATAMCAPTRQQILTGLWPVRNGAYPNHSRVYDGVKGLPAYFRELGYRVGRTGKKHFGPDEAFPFEVIGKGDREPVPGKMEEIDAFLTRDKGQPFFLWIASHQPHMPRDVGDASAYPPEKLEVPPHLVDDISTRQRLSAYYAEITWMDQQLGAVLASVAKAGQAAETLFLFCGEHGTQAPFSKWTLYENGLKAAFIARWPGRVQAGSRTAAMTQYVDLLPTLLEAAGGVAPAGLDGRSFLRVLEGKATRHHDHVFGVQTTKGIINGGAGYPIRSVRDARYKYIRNLRPDLAFTNVLTDAARDSILADWEKLPQGKERAAFYRRRPAEELYDLQVDPFELKNLAAEPRLAAVKKRLSARLDAWMKQQGDEGWATEQRAGERRLKGAE